MLGADTRLAILDQRFVGDAEGVRCLDLGQVAELVEQVAIELLAFTGGTVLRGT